MNYPHPEPNGHDVILNKVLAAATSLTQDWERAFSDPIAPQTRLVADLGCQSLDIVVLIADLSRQLDQRDIPLEELLLPDGKPAQDISLMALANFLWEHNKSCSPIIV